MPWVKIDDHYPDHPKLQALGDDYDAGMSLDMRGKCYCAANLTDGFIPARVFRHEQATIDRLVAVGLWEVADGGYAVHDYLEYNPSRAKVEADRAATRERVNRWRNAGCNAVTDAVSNAASNTSPVPVPVPLREEERGDRADERPEGKPMETTDVPACLSTPITVTDPAYTGTCFGFIVHSMEQRFGTITSHADLATLKTAIVTGCIPGCTGEYAQLCAMQIVGKLNAKGKGSFRTSNLWLKCVREDRMEVRS